MSERVRIGVLATHPIQYYSPLYRELAKRPGVDLTVYYAHRPSAEEQGEGFGVPFTWDVDLLSGYESVWLRNRASPATDGGFRGYDTPEIRDRVRASAFDAFLVAGWHARTYWQAMRSCWRAGVPVLVRGDSQLGDEPTARRLAKRTLYPLFMQRFGACLSVGRRSDEYFRYFGARAVVRAPHFVDNAFFASAAAQLRPARAQLREQWGLPADAFVVLFAGKLVPKKRPVDVLQAVSRLRGRGIHVLFAGDGPLRNTVEREAERLGVPAHFTGFLNQGQIPSAYVAADVLALPSDARETWGLVVNEAMASGLPAVVSTAAGCYPDLIVEERTGFGFPLGDTVRLAETLMRVMTAQNQAKLGRAAEEHVGRYSVHAAADGVLRGVATARGLAA